MATLESDVIDLARRQADICKLFGNSTRVLILWVLTQGEMNVSDIASIVGASLQNTSQHLRLMKDKGVLTARRDGNSIVYQLGPHEGLEGCRLMKMADGVGPILAASSLDRVPENLMEAYT